jgi:hypothetical protein
MHSAKATAHLYDRPLFAIAIGLSLRVALALFTPGNLDQQNFTISAQILRSGANIYNETPYYNYTPIWGSILAMLSLLNIPLPIMVRVTLIAIDMANSWLISRTISVKAALTYLLNPVSIILVGYHGQFETLAMLPILLATWLIQQGKLAHTRIWLLGTLALIIKHIVLFHVWALFIWLVGIRRAWIWYAGTIILFALSFTPFLPDGIPGIMQHVLLYRSIYRFGPAWFLPPPLDLALFVCAMSILPLMLRGRSLSEVLERTSVGLLVLIPAIGQQYFLLPLLTARSRSNGYLIFTLSAMLFLLASPDGFRLSWLPAIWWPTWLAAVFWLIELFIKSHAPPRYWATRMAEHPALRRFVERFDRQ